MKAFLRAFKGKYEQRLNSSSVHPDGAHGHGEDSDDDSDSADNGHDGEYDDDEDEFGKSGKVTLNISVGWSGTSFIA